MTRQICISEIKTGRTTTRSIDGGPRPGTHLRELYDALRRGEGVTANGGTLTTLRDIYGMDLRWQRDADQRAGYRKPAGRYFLVGEWEGPYFVPVERILQQDAS